MELRESQKTKRIAWIDNGKALAISLVALGHMQSIYVVNEVIFSFVMPAFFFLSGVTFDRSAKAPFVELLRKKFRSLIIPYFGFSAILFLFWFFVRRNFGLSYQTDATVTDVLLQILLNNSLLPSTVAPEQEKAPPQSLWLKNSASHTSILAPCTAP